MAREKIRPSQRENMPPSSFLIPSEKKYPVKRKNKLTGKWEFDANFIVAAERRARMNRDRAVESKALALRKRHPNTKGD